MASITELPAELLDFILADLGSRAIINLAQTCKALHAVAIPAAYHTVTLTWDNTYSKETRGPQRGMQRRTEKAPRIQSLIRTLTKKPEYILLIKRLEFCAKGCVEYGYLDLADTIFPDIECDGYDKEWENEMFKVLVRDRGMQPGDRGWAQRVLIALLVGTCQAHLESLTMEWGFFLGNPWFPTMMRHAIVKNAAASEADDGQPLWFANLKTVCVTLEETEGAAATWERSFWIRQEALLHFFYLPAIESLDIVTCSLRGGNYDDYGGLWDEADGVDGSFEWPLKTPPLSQTLTTLRLTPSSMDPLTIQYLLRQTPNVKVFQYDCCLHPAHPPLRLSILRDTLRHIRDTLTDLTVRYKHYNNDGSDDPPTDAAEPLREGLGPLHDFPVLTTLTTSFPVLFGMNNTPNLAKHLPPTLETLTITNDLSAYQALGMRFEDLNAMAIFRQYLAGQILASSVVISHEGDSCKWVQDREPEWKAATPRLRKLTYDVGTQLFTGYWLGDEPRERLLGLCKTQGIEGDVVPQYDSFGRLVESD
ncbi:uncharacterized protein J4E84_009718 [Alternaria hordeiaustralica]|uniref:uncharacterized protein n=1 Tax=Alternaria hordeiaustralica TaxID=1187925 RepID=UPI0020C4EF9C|nr:uncharacterized protein J4E84_009718 [Alternaria hordeiaustralica]KAI4676101.1 hypothetical protein J4E84_009718 [Alternaria hordeiaustralica]